MKKIDILHSHPGIAVAFFLVVFGFIYVSTGQIAHANSKIGGISTYYDTYTPSNNQKDTNRFLDTGFSSGPTYNHTQTRNFNESKLFQKFSEGAGGAEDDTGRLESLQSQLQATLDRIAKLNAQIAGLNNGGVGSTTARTIGKQCLKAKRCGETYTISDVSTITFKHLRQGGENRATTTQYIVNLADKSKRVFVNNGSTTTPFSERFVQKVRKTGYTGDIAALLAKATPQLPVVKSFALDDVKTIVFKNVDPLPGAVDDEYKEFTITLDAGPIVVVKGHAGRGTETMRFSPFRKAGFRGDVEKLLAMASQSQVLGVSTSAVGERVSVDQLTKIEVLKKKVLVAQDTVTQAVARLAELQKALDALLNDTTPTPTKPQTKNVVIESFTVTPKVVRLGQKVEFAWVSNVTANDVSKYGGGCSIEGLSSKSVALYVANPGQINTRGALSYTPPSTATYTLFCTSNAKDGSPSARAQVSVTVTGQGGGGYSQAGYGGGGTSNLKIVAGQSSENPDATTLPVEISDVSDWYTIFAFELKNTSTHEEVTLNQMAVDVITTGGTVGEVVHDLQIVADGSAIDEVTWSSQSSTRGTAVIDLDGDVTIAPNSTLKVEVQAQFNELTDNYDAGATVRASFDAKTIQGESDADLTTSQLTGSVSGETHTLRNEGPVLATVSSSAVLKPNTKATTDDEGVFTLVVEVTAHDTDTYIARGVSGSGAGLVFLIVDANNQFVTTGGKAITELTSTADVVNGYYLVSEGETEKFTLKVTFDPTVSGSYALDLMALVWQKSPSGTGQSVPATAPEFTTKPITI